MVINNINLSLKIIFKNMFKNFISLFGIIMGITIFVILFSILKYDKNIFLHNCKKAGSNFIKVHTLNFNKDKKYYLNFDDIKSLKYSNLSIESISPEVYFKGIISNKFTNLGCYIIGGTEDYRDFMIMDMMFGRFFSKHECINKENVIIIDNFTSMKLFGVENSLGREIYIGDSKIVDKYKIIGIMKYPSNIWKKNSNIPSFCIIPVDNFIYKFKTTSFFEYVYVSIKNTEDIYNVSNSIINFLKVKNNISKDVYQIENFIKQENYIKNMSDIFIKVVKFIIYIFIFLSGINIMNFMSFNISCRAKEIGIRRSVGASRYDIFMQFVIESCILSLLLGIIGIIIGGVISHFLKFFTNMQLKLNILDIFVFLLVYFLIGICFGSFSAIKACRIDPIYILNYE